MVRQKIKLIFLSILFFSSIIISQSQTKSVNAVRTNTPKIDGIYDDNEWQAAEVASGFVQREPNEGNPSTQNTEVRFLYDDKYLYIGIKCYDDNPELISEAFSNRDSYGTGDYVGVMLDTFHDHLNSYLFAVTASGTQIDGRCFSDTKRNFDWDGIWWSETSTTDYGWAAELKIPFSTLQFDENQDEWGVNIFRNISRERELSYWQFQNRDYQFKISSSGHLKNLKDIYNGTNLNISPYITTQFNGDRTSDFKMRNKNGVSGFDLKYGLTSNLNLVVTVNPDFAQIEADDEQINLSHYPLYLSEKRPFFLEGKEIFRTQGTGHSSQLFYSRRINDPLYGVKLSGKVGDWNIGFLHSLNDNDGGINSKIENEELSQNFDNSAYYNILRINRDIFENSQIGMIALSKEYSGKYSRILGVDGQLSFWNNYDFFFELSKSLTDGETVNDNHSVTMVFKKSSDFLAYSLNYDEQGSGFIGNEVGFYNYNNFRKVNAGIRFGPRFEDIGIRWMGIGMNAVAQNYQDKNFFSERTLTREFEIWSMISTMNYWALRVSARKGKNYDRIDEMLYNKLRYSIYLDNNKNSDVYFSLSHNQGNYRTGYNWSYKAELEIKPTDKLKVIGNYNRSLVKYTSIDTKEFIETYYEIFRTKVYYYFSNKLDLRLITQYNALDERLNTYFLIGYRFAPGCALFLAYNEQYDSESYLYDEIEYYPEFSSSQKILQLKFSYLIQF